MNFTNYTLGEALSSQNETIKRNAFSILKQLQKERDKQWQLGGVIDMTKVPQCDCGRVQLLGTLGHHDDCNVYKK